MTITVATFVLVLTTVLAAHRFVVVAPERDARRRLRDRLAGAATAQGERLDVSAGTADLTQRRAFGDGGSQWHDRASSRVKQLIDQAGWTIGVRAMVVLIVLGCGLPWLALVYARHRRLRQFETLLPDAVDVMARAIRAGHPLPPSLQIVGEEMPDPVGSEFRRMADQFRFGVPLADALREFADRVPLVDARFLATAILLQRETGGNLPELLDNLAAVIHDRLRVRRHLRTCTAHGRLTGWILGGLPPAIALAIFMTNPGYLLTLVIDPLGHYLIGAAMTLELLGIALIRRMVRVEY